MTERLVFDDRLLNPYAVEDLAAHAPLHRALQAWFAAFGDFDDSSLTKLIAARSPAEVDRWRTKAEAALASIPPLVAALDAVIRELEAARRDPGSGIDPSRLDALADAANVNRVALTDQAPALVAAALSVSPGYDDARAKATEAIERTVRRVEALRDRSADPNAGFGQLQPLIAELRQVWGDLDRDLAALSRTDQRAVRALGEARLKAAAGALCRNLFARKQRDRARGAWPRPVVPDPGNAAPDRFAAALARRDVEAAHHLVADWLASAWSANRLAEALTRAADAVAAAGDLSEAPPVAGWHVDPTPLSYPALRGNATLAAVVPPEVTAENFRGWFIVELQTDEEDGYLTDVDCVQRAYVAVVATPTGDRIGHLAFGE